jgi:hypothetical protein
MARLSPQLTTDGEKGYAWGADPTGRDTTNKTVCHGCC